MVFILPPPMFTTERLPPALFISPLFARQAFPACACAPGVARTPVIALPIPSTRGLGSALIHEELARTAEL
eukprot:scaffold4431_cov111-Isochrysis_galbana.AAC.2